MNSAAVVVRVRPYCGPEYLTVRGVFQYPEWTSTAAQAEVFSLARAASNAQAHGGEPVIVHSTGPEHIEERVRKAFQTPRGDRVNYTPAKDAMASAFVDAFRYHSGDH